MKPDFELTNLKRSINTNLIFPREGCSRKLDSREPQVFYIFITNSLPLQPEFSLGQRAAISEAIVCVTVGDIELVVQNNRYLSAVASATFSSLYPTPCWMPPQPISNHD
jgi:hypothetical protein